MEQGIAENSLNLRNNSNISKLLEEKIFHKAILIRTIEEKLLEAFTLGKLHGTIHTCIGQELVGVIVSEFLKKGDSVFSNHRCHGHFIGFTQDTQGLISEIFGKKTGVCGGRGGSQHLYKNDFYSNGIQGGVIPIAAGLAFAKKLNKTDNIAVVYIGDGTLGEGILYETLNIISKWNLPLLVVLENNLYAQSTHQSETMAGNILDRAKAFNVLSKKENTWNWQGLYQTTDNLVNYVRKESKPAFLQIDTYRLKAHSKGDDNRTKEEVEPYEKLDPINKYALKHKEHYLYSVNANLTIVNKALSNAENDICFDQVENIILKTDLTHFSIPEEENDIRLSKAINNAFKEIMSVNQKILFIGEDVKSPYGGAFKISENLSDLFPEQVINTPISEAAIVGIGCGLALKGYYPIIEIMFGDFTTLCMDQILNHASKFRYIYNEQVNIPLIIRTPMGGNRGYGPTHSQTLDKHFFGIPGLKILAINNLIDPKYIYKALIESNQDPVFIIENKVLYTKLIRNNPPRGFEYNFFKKDFPTVIISPTSKKIDVTIISYGGLSDIIYEVVDRLFEEYDIIAQFICPIQIYPYDILLLSDFLLKSKILFVVEEGQGFAGFGSEIITQLVESGIQPLPIIKRIFPASSPIAACRTLESNTLPNIESIIKSIRETYHACNNDHS